MKKPLVAIIGRRNVGKSTLLNRMLGRRLSIVADLPGTTRDRIFADITWNDVVFTAIDTGGLTLNPESRIELDVESQVNTAMTEADLIIFMVDVKDRVTVVDKEIAGRLREASKPLLLVANKADNDMLEIGATEFYELGLGEPLAISAYHGRGIDILLDRVTELLPPGEPQEAGPEGIKVAIVGHPGVGKSMLLNALLGTERAIVGDMPGTTRDAVDSMIDFNGQNVILIDTAGIKRRGHVGRGVEEYSVIRAMRAIERSDIALLVLDATEMVTAQDTHVAGYIVQATRGIVLIVNKWDLVMSENTDEYTNQIKSKMKFAPYAPLLYISAKLKWGLERILPQALAVYRERCKKVDNARLKEIIKQAVSAHSPPRVGRKQLKILSVSQTEINPPCFVFLVNNPGLIHFSYRRYMENRLRDSFGFNGTPLRLVFKARG
ncbi:MAG: ribosome biogenesis GTPase Der [Chloroflexota bacterium]